MFWIVLFCSCFWRLDGLLLQGGTLKEGDAVTLNSYFIMMDDNVIQWRFGKENTLIAEINVTADRIAVYDDVLDGRFRDRLKLDNQTGSLTITDITTENLGDYTLEINGVRKENFHVNMPVSMTPVFVLKGDSVTLNSDLTEMKRYDWIQWRFENTIIAQINKEFDRIAVYDDVLGGRFRDRLKLDNQTGSLTITNTTDEHTGLYERKTKFWTTEFFLVVFNEISVKEGDSVTLNSDLTEMKHYDWIRWRFKNEKTVIAVINKRFGRIAVYDDVFDGRFRDRLKLDKQTGSLTITDTRTEHTGVYKLQMRVSDRLSLKAFRVSVYAHLPVPVISRDCSSSSSSSCSLVCSAVNVSLVTLSWYKGDRLLSSISACNLSSLSLPLEVEYQDENTYSCVINNPIRNQTQHLDNISQLCHTCAGNYGSLQTQLLAAIISAVVLAVLAVVMYCLYRKHRRSGPEGNYFKPSAHAAETVQIDQEEVVYTETTFVQDVQNKKPNGTEETVYSTVIKH